MYIENKLKLAILPYLSKILNNVFQFKILFLQLENQIKGLNEIWAYKLLKNCGRYNGVCLYIFSLSSSLE